MKKYEEEQAELNLEPAFQSRREAASVTNQWISRKLWGSCGGRLGARSLVLKSGVVNSTDGGE